MANDSFDLERCESLLRDTERAMLRIASLKRIPPALAGPMKIQVVDELQSGLDALAGRRVDPMRVPLELRRRELAKLESVIAEALTAIETQRQHNRTAAPPAAEESTPSA